MRVGVFMFGGVELPDAGLAGTPPLDRRYGQEAIDHVHRELLACGELAEQLGYDSFWLTEHHFQHEGYEVVPNGLLFSAFLAARTTRLRIGTMFNVVGQWHPLRLAEDFALLHNLSGGRGILGVGRGTVPREMLPLTAGRVSVGSYDNPSAAEADRINREVTEESLDVLQLAMRQETFSYAGKHLCLPPPGIPDRGGAVARARRRLLAQGAQPARRRLARVRRHLPAGARPPAAEGREADAGAQRGRRRHEGAGHRRGPRRARRVLAVPRPLRLGPRLRRARRTAGWRRLRADARGLDGPGTVGGRHSRRSRGGDRRPRRPAWPDRPGDLPGHAR